MQLGSSWFVFPLTLKKTGFDGSQPVGFSSYLKLPLMALCLDELSPSKTQRPQRQGSLP